jgi:hypothetical protein
MFSIFTFDEMKGITSMKLKKKIGHVRGDGAANYVVHLIHITGEAEKLLVASTPVSRSFFKAQRQLSNLIKSH